MGDSDQMWKKTGKPVEINEMDTGNIYDLKNVMISFGSNFNTNEKGESVIWKEIKKIKVEKEMPYLLLRIMSIIYQCSSPVALAHS